MSYDEGERILYSRRRDAGWLAPRILGPGREVELSVDAAGRTHAVSGTASRVVHRWLTRGGWVRRVVAEGITPDSVDIRAFGRGASLAWATQDDGRGVWVVED